ncbi:MAG TPA: M12 family metallo-peptidase, partial [Thermoanaerobaculia bacterium]|nr:M12 family metallo-peptidase [Thermoanaerobaculia bacterium]
GGYDYYLTEMDDSDATQVAGQTWSCGVEKLPGFPAINKRLLVETDASGHPVIALGISGTQSYAIAVEVETDAEFYINSGSNTTTATQYITNLTGAVSTIYNRDIHTNVVQQNLHLYTGGTGSDPWAATDSLDGLYELGDYYHANHSSLKRSAVMMLSGKSVPQGIAYEAVVCGGDLFDNSSGHWTGAYAWAGGIGNLFGFQGLGPVPDPNATNNGIQYGMPGDGTPSGTQTYWPLEEYAHELGHNLAGHHTHCVAITATEALGTNHPTQLFVDACDTTEGAGCATGTASAPTEKGTIMSYCHELSPIPQQSRYTFGQASEVSHHELDDYMLNASLGGGVGTSNIVTAVGTFSMSSISGSSSVAPNSTGNTASVTPVNGGSVTYSWSITGGTITSSSTTSSITYTAGASGSVVLRANLFNTNGCGVSDTKTVTITTVSPPTNVVATAASTTSVQVTWTAAAGAATYEVSRSSNNSTFTPVCGNPTPACPSGTSFTDTSATASHSYIYKVKSVDASLNKSAFSNGDLATTVIFTDDQLAQNTTPIQAVHLTQLRTAIDAVRALAGLGGGTYTDLAPAGIIVKKTHMDELRAALTPARTNLGLSTTYTDPTITLNMTLIKAVHFQELREFVK